MPALQQALAALSAQRLLTPQLLTTIDDKGRTPLIVAVSHNNADMAKLLLQVR